MADFKKGDRVRVVRAVTTPAGTPQWTSGMDKYVNNGVVYEIFGVEQCGYRLENTESGARSGYIFPADALQPSMINAFGERITTHNIAALDALRGVTLSGVAFPKLNFATEASMELKIEDRVYVNGVQVNSAMTDDTIINYIANAETEIERLSKVKTKSAAITARVESLRAGAVRLAALLDERAAAK